MAELPAARRPQSRPAQLDQAVARLAYRQHGVVALRQLVQLGLSERAVHHRAAAGRLHRVHRGVYAVGHLRLTRDGARMAAVLAGGPGAVLSGLSAGDAWGLRPYSGPHHVLVPGPRRNRHAGIRVHRTRRMRSQDAQLLRGIPVTSVSLTIVGMAASLEFDPLERAVHAARVRNLLDPGDLCDLLASSSGRRGVGMLRRILAEESPGSTESPIEELLLALCRAEGLPIPEFNAGMHVRGRRIYVDALWERERVVAEVDAFGTHGSRASFESDRDRDAALAAQGFLPIRFTMLRLEADPAGVAADLRAALSWRARGAG